MELVAKGPKVLDDQITFICNENHKLLSGVIGHVIVRENFFGLL